MKYVFDCSFTAALIFPDESSEQIRQLFSTIAEEDEIFVPHLWWYEMTNTFRNLVRRKRYGYQETLNFIPNISALNVITDSLSGSIYTEKLFRLANDYNLSAYDAVYLELAERKQAVLGTMDGDLKAAAEKHGVKIMGNYKKT